MAMLANNANAAAACDWSLAKRLDVRFFNCVEVPIITCVAWSTHAKRKDAKSGPYMLINGLARQFSGTVKSSDIMIPNTEHIMKYGCNFYKKLV